jgi:hypothetical protein
MISIPVQSVIPNNELNVRMLQNLFFEGMNILKSTVQPHLTRRTLSKVQEHTHGLQQQNKLPRAAVGSMVSIPPVM